MTSSRQLRIFFLPIVILVLLLLLALPTSRLDGQVESPTVYAVFFYSPTCPHCHKVIDEDMPVFEAEFGDSLQIIPVDVTQEWGGALYGSACATFDTANQCGGVPLLLVSNIILIGDQEIPARLPGITRAGLEAGGIPIADFPGSADLLAAWNRVLEEQSLQETAVAETSIGSIETLDTSTTLLDRLQADPEANALAIMILLGLLFSIAWMTWERYGGDLVNLQTPALIVAGVLGLLLAMSLISTESDDSTAMIFAYGLVGLLGLALFLIPLPQTHSTYVVPLVILAGIAVATYLTHIETTENSAVCGFIGDCNTVQQSDYAKLFGFLPVGVVGVLAYVSLLALWGLSKVPSLSGESRHRLETLMLVFVLGGALFSAYLTFLEPFVIGATCVWCLTSAVTMLLLLWLIAPAFLRQGRQLTIKGS